MGLLPEGGVGRGQTGNLENPPRALPPSKPRGGATAYNTEEELLKAQDGQGGWAHRDRTTLSLRWSGGQWLVRT